MTKMVRATYLVGENFRKQDFIGEKSNEEFLTWLERTAREEDGFQYLGCERFEYAVCWKYNSDGHIEVWDGILPVGKPDLVISTYKDVEWFFDEHIQIPLTDVHVNDWDVCENPGHWFKRDYGIIDDLVNELAISEDEAVEFLEDEAVEIEQEEEQPMSAFEVWFRTFIEEKDLDVEVWEIEHKDQIHIIDNYDMVEIVCDLPSDQQKKIKDKLVGIDFLNGNVNHFLKYLAEGYIATMY
jgi:hypothetical protein